MMTTDRCIHRIAHNTAQELPTSFQPCLSVPSTLAFSLLYYPLRPAAGPARRPRLQHSRLPPLSSPLPSAPSPSERLPPRRGENERAHMHARIICAAAPRSLIVHRNRNCVPASHVPCGLPSPLSCPSDSPFVRSGFSTLPSASFRTIRRSPVIPSTIGPKVPRSIDKSHVCLYRVGRS